MLEREREAVCHMQENEKMHAKEEQQVVKVSVRVCTRERERVNIR